MVNAAQRTRVKVEADNRPSVDTHPPGVQPSPGTGGTRHHNFMLCVVLAVPVCTLLPAGTTLFTKQRRASPDDGLLLNPSGRRVTAGVLLCFVEKLTDRAGSIC
ncbi:hypothetical protein MJ583_05660 [Escherichia coli]|nr:hypothetical protein MJ583_05660 [Escherichia coli]